MTDFPATKKVALEARAWGDETRTYAKLDELHIDPANARLHSPRNIDAIVASLREYGQQSPIVIAEDGKVIAGNGRLEAARKLGLEELWVVQTDLSEMKRLGFAIADNRTAELAEWDEEVLASLLETARDHPELDLESTGWTEKEAERFWDAMVTDGEGDGAAAPDPEIPKADQALEKWGVSQGEVWQIGDHRLICGDCRDPKVVDRLLDGRKVNLAFTSPPYASQRVYDESSGFRPIRPDDYVDWFEAVQAPVQKSLASDGSWFVNIKTSADGLDTSLYVIDLVAAHVRKWGWHFATEYCWERSGIPKQVTQRFKNQFEPVYQFALGRWKMRPDDVRHQSDAVPQAKGKGAGATSWGNQRQGIGGGAVPDNDVKAGLAYPGNRLPTYGQAEALGHTAAFPVGLPSFFVRAYSDPGDSVYDPFMGSGTTMVAAHNHGRHGYGCELSPGYCAVILERMSALGLAPKKVEP